MVELENLKEYLIKKRRDIKTIDSYCTDCRLFFEYIKKPIDTIDYFDIEKYKKFLLNNNYKVSSINRKMISIHTLFKCNNYNVEVVQEKVQKQTFLENLFTKQDIDKMIQVMDTNKDYRTKSLLLTMYYTGMRISEVLSITVYDIDKDVISVCGKGKKYRQILISDKLRSIWKEYIRYRIKKGNSLFTGERGRLTRQTSNKLLKKYAELCGVNIKKAHNHNLRHMFAKTLVVDKKIDIATVGQLLGHVTLDTTRIYTQQSKEELIDIINDL